MRPNPQFPADLVTFTEEIVKGKLHFLHMVKVYLGIYQRSMVQVYCLSRKLLFSLY